MTRSVSPELGGQGISLWGEFPQWLRNTAGLKHCYIDGFSNCEDQTNGSGNTCSAYFKTSPTWRDEHWVLCYMLANQTPIKTYTKRKEKQPHLSLSPTFPIPQTEWEFLGVGLRIYIFNEVHRRPWYAMHFENQWPSEWSSRLLMGYKASGCFLQPHPPSHLAP